ncbi:ComEC/Rec2 family competence protein [Archangium sp.]|uniref:ComEC/Rec2 family competence protein n=1 Tax=Archangium sp. TaxID=1872627 RepID=UPI00286BD48B|nr:ComEC/Rec2 family competence protein [Archangium sp.]
MAFVRRLLTLLVLLAAVPGQAQTLKPLTVHFFDVGQGDAALIISPGGKTVLIDGGPPEADDRLVPRLRELVKGPLDLVILSHPHLDHLGGMGKVIQAVGVRRYMDPGFDHGSEAYRKLLDVVGKKAEKVMTPTPNPSAPETLLTIGLGEGATLTILWPRSPQDAFLDKTRSDVNANSIVAKLTYGNTAFLFMGDAEPETEEFLLRKPIDFTSTVLKVGHHGGRHSSTEPFLAAVQPQAAIISSGKGNEYGHPTEEALQRLGDVGARIFRTDQQGEIRAVSNGTTVTFTTEKNQRGPAVVSGKVPSGPVATGAMRSNSAWVVNARGTLPERQEAMPASGTLSSGSERYVSLKGSDVFHRENCGALKRAKTQERTHYTTRSAAQRERRPAKDCNP